MIPDTPSQGGFGHAVAFILGLFLVWTIVAAVSWNVGLYGAGLVDHKIGFWTAFGLAMCMVVLRNVIGVRSAPQPQALPVAVLNTSNETKEGE